jgi:hypothetical protein
VTEKLRVVEMKPNGNAADIVRCMRSLADRIERGEQDAECVLCIVEPDANTETTLFIWGVARPLTHVVGLLTREAFNVNHGASASHD